MKHIFFIVALTLLFNISCSKDSSEGLGSPNNTGKSGSMSKFAFNGNYLYVVNGSELKVYSVQNSADPKLLNTKDLDNNGVETIFSHGSNLFFGTQNGLLIYGLNDPANPNYMSTYTHVVSCDPVVVSGNRAYVTLSSGNRCNRGIDRLEIIDISNLYNPYVLVTYSFKNPKGLAVDGNYLYLCDDDYGLKVLDISDISDVKLVETAPCSATDVIKNGNVLTVTGDVFVYQFDCSDPLNLIQLSRF